MSAKMIYRMSAVLFVVFAVGHTYGFLRFKPPTPEALATQAAMDSVSFQIGRASYSLGGFYVGFGLYCTAYLLFSACLAWQLGGLSVTHARAISSIAWTLFAVQIASLVLSARYFGPPQVTLSVFAAGLLGWGAWRLRRNYGVTNRALI